MHIWRTPDMNMEHNRAECEYSAAGDKNLFEEMYMKKSTIFYSFKASLPVMAGYVVLGMGFGILMNTKGYGWYWAALMSLLVYAGSMQYVAIDLLASGANMITFALMTLAVNARHLFYGLTMLGKYKQSGKAKPYLIFALTDETFSLVCSAKLPEGVDENCYYFFVSLFDQIYWIFGSILGAFVGAALSFNSNGVEFAMTSLFTIVVIEQWEKGNDHFPALTGFIVSLLCLIIFGASNFLIPSMIVISFLLLAKHYIMKRQEKGESSHES